MNIGGSNEFRSLEPLSTTELVLNRKLRVGENNRVDVCEERNEMRVFYRGFARMRTVVPILKVNVDETVGFVAVEKTHALANRDQVIVENRL